MGSVTNLQFCENNFSLLPENIRVGERILTAPLDAGALFYFQWQISHASPHINKDQIAAKLHSSWTPRRPKPWGSLGDTSGASTVMELNARSPVAVDLDRTSLSLGADPATIREAFPATGVEFNPRYDGVFQGRRLLSALY